MAVMRVWRYAQLCSHAVLGRGGAHQPMKVMLQSRQVARDPWMAMSRCRHFLQKAQRRPDLSGTSCLQAAISSRLFAKLKIKPKSVQTRRLQLLLT